jgi:O-antigen/teichoic acid export membrane protein
MNKKVLIWNFIFQYGYTITNILNSIILLPLYVEKIDTITLGLWLATGNILTWLTMVDPGVGDVAQQRIAELNGKGQFVNVSKTIGSALMTSVAIFIITMIVGLGFYFSLDTLINKNLSNYPNFYISFIISVIATGLTLVSFGLHGINQGLQNSASVAISYLSSNILFLIVNIILLNLGYGILSIAVANLSRAACLLFYNGTVVYLNSRKGNIAIVFDVLHFKKFIKIFSFTSVSSIISTFANNCDLLILSRFIPTSLVTLFEINRRPVKLTQTLAGRYSVALMPLISHAKGSGDAVSIRDVTEKRFKYYSLIIIFISSLFIIIYSDLIALWIKNNQYAGDEIMYLLVGCFFFGSHGYYLNNVAYALGDIKMNSLINTTRGLVLIILFFATAKFGITGILVISLVIVIIFDFVLFACRLNFLGFFQKAIIRDLPRVWLFIIPVCVVSIATYKITIHYFLSDKDHFLKLIFGVIYFSGCFFSGLTFIDNQINKAVKHLVRKVKLFA